MKILVCSLAMLFALSANARAQKVELSGGWVHMSGDGGLDGFDVGAAAWFTNRVSIAFDYDSGWDTSHLGAFELTSTGVIVSKSRLQNFLIGPRIFFPGVIKSKQRNVALLLPFGEAQFGVSNLDSKLETTNVSQSASDTAFSWMLGGGVDYRFSPHWVGRLKVDLLRTHLADSGQSRVRLGLGVAYTFGQR
jgi:hypothetical protein